ncbi:FecR family protein [Flavobacterium glycines]|jgi:ferric-dicitrate binding protein FerR (iron transport regulator)|uniref:FecR family protein n=1 Tax=Flavobacterium glycines TaxID=551990 RepID=A0A1B9DKR9_9FLAO|nr:FecR domain-containing protein [Flavobacterium glycines]OCB70281.1 iron dicitrate transport regulator FecR [Flavobacterium glycines]GEL11682.1 iron dicitrate transporter FecR [Flavobacterium glycines]SDJ70443.1 FecR family protein [Flavobacterium glycines]
MKKNYLLAKWLNNELSAQELAEFEASPDFEKYQKIKKYSEHLEVGALDEDTMLATILQHKKETPKVISISKKWILRIAAIFILGIGLTFAMQNFIPQSQVANYAQKTSFYLPDDSQVVLNSGSKIEFKKWKWKSHRKLELDGEAYFKVAKGRRFEVITNLGKVTVLGTQFDVKARKNKFDVTCYEGRVKVNYKNSQIILTHGQSVTFENNKQINTTTTSLKPEWIDGIIAFKNENIQNILDELQRQYDITIQLKSNTSNSLFTGKLPSNNLEVATRIISTTYNLKARKINSTTIIFEEK